MQCPKCGHINQSAKFCVKCGTSLLASTATEGVPQAQPPVPPQVQQPQVPQPPVPPQAAPQVQPQVQQGTYGQPAQFNQPNPQLQQAKQVANQFFNLFIQALKRPLRVSEQTNGSLMGSGIISVLLFAFLVPTLIYFELKTIADGEEIPYSFGQLVLQPFVMLLVISVIAQVLIYAVLRLGNISLSFKDVVARYGAFLIPSVTILFIGFLLALMGANATFVLCVFALAFFAWITAIGSTIYSYKHAHTGGLDLFYGVLATITATLLVIYLFRDVLLERFIEGFLVVLARIIFPQIF